VDQQELKQAGLKITTPRVKILRILEQTGNRHMSAEEVFKTLLDAGEDIALATVYRVLTQFHEADLVKRHNFEEGRAVFELNDSGHHDHLVCVKCAKVEEFVDDTIEARQQAIADKFNFQMTDHNLNIYGICHTCQ
jgi:Fur family ferric uptake transcriptional regulator